MRSVFDHRIYDSTRFRFPELVAKAEEGDEDAARLLYRIDLGMEVSYINGKRGEPMGDFRPIVEGKNVA